MSASIARDRRRRLVADEHRDVGGDLVVARARGVELAADRAGELGDPPLDRHVDVDVVVGEREAILGELDLDLLERRVQRVAVGSADDPLRGEHPGVRARLRDVVAATAAGRSPATCRAPGRPGAAARRSAAHGAAQS